MNPNPQFKLPESDLMSWQEAPYTSSNRRNPSHLEMVPTYFSSQRANPSKHT